MRVQNFFIAVLVGNLIVAFFALSHMYAQQQNNTTTSTTPVAFQLPSVAMEKNHLPEQSTAQVLKADEAVKKITADIKKEEPKDNSVSAVASTNINTTANILPVNDKAPIKPGYMCYESQVNETNVRELLVAALAQQKVYEVDQKDISHSSKRQIYWGLSENKMKAQSMLSDMRDKGVIKSSNVNLTLVRGQYALNVATVANPEEAQDQVAKMSQMSKNFGGIWFDEPTQIDQTFISFQLDAAGLKLLSQKLPGLNFKACR